MTMEKALSLLNMSQPNAKRAAVMLKKMTRKTPLRYKVAASFVINNA